MSVAASGYNVELLTNTRIPMWCRKGLKYVHNDTCYPALLVIGQMIVRTEQRPVRRGRIRRLIITQTGGGCRASNYIHLLRKALKKAGYGQVPVISLNLSGMEPNAGFRLTIPMLRKALAGIVYGDMLMLLRNQTRPYERREGAANALSESVD